MEITEDGLVKADFFRIEINQQTNELILKDNQKKLFLSPYIKAVFSYLKERDLLKISYIKVSESSDGMKRVPCFGVGFSKAIELVKGFKIQKEKQSSRFYTVDGSDENSSGIQADFRVHIEAKDNQIQIEAWQIGKFSGSSEYHETFYIHGFINIEKNVFTHFDGAVMFLSEVERQLLYETGVKPKNDTYQKYFRLDGEISMEDTIELSKKFLPVEELASEYFV